MKKQKQTIFGRKGNCFATCIANLMNIDIKDVPNFIDPVVYKNDWYGYFIKWLDSKGYSAISIEMEKGKLPSMHVDNIPNGYLCIASGKSPRNCQHAVIVQANVIRGYNKNVIYNDLEIKFVHDPHPESLFIVNVDILTLLFKKL